MPLYKLIHQNLLQSGNLQADETPIRYLDPGRGKCATGYLWVIHAPRNGIKGDILYQWHPSRKAACLDDLIGNYHGLLQTDAYADYDSWTAGKPGITLVACWAHARRKFHEALQIGQTLAAGPLATIQQLYHVEAGLRQTRADAAERHRIRREKRRAPPASPQNPARRPALAPANPAQGQTRPRHRLHPRPLGAAQPLRRTRLP